jgi:hypothetical protein
LFGIYDAFLGPLQLGCAAVDGDLLTVCRDFAERLQAFYDAVQGVAVALKIAAANPLSS